MNEPYTYPLKGKKEYFYEGYYYNWIKENELDTKNIKSHYTCILRQSVANKLFDGAFGSGI